MKISFKMPIFANAIPFTAKTQSKIPQKNTGKKHRKSLKNTKRFSFA